MIPSPSQIADDYGLRALKNLGQNFLFDLNITRKIVSHSGSLDGLNIVEIGPGPGGLTQAILEQPIKKLTVIEFDRRAVEGLEELKKHYPEKLEIIQGDALSFDLREVAPEPCAVLANLPYNISTKLLTDWLEYAHHFEFLALMFQKEVAERICSEPGSKDYGRLSVITQWLCQAEILFTLPPSVFTPPPKVSSSIVKITPRKEPLYPADKKKLERVLATAFNQRRKMIKSSLKPLLPEAEKCLTELGINPTLRAENLTIQEFCKIANFI